MANQLSVLSLSVLFGVVHWSGAAVVQWQGRISDGVPFDPTNPEDVAKLARDNIPEVSQPSHVEPYLESHHGESKDTCLPGYVRVFAGLRRYDNGKNYNERGQKCDWTIFGTAKCDPIFNTEFQYENPKGNMRSEQIRNGHFQDSTTVSFNANQASKYVCAASNTYVRINLNVYDDDVTTQNEKIGSWDFSFAAVTGHGEYASNKRSQQSDADVTVFFQS